MEARMTSRKMVKMSLVPTFAQAKKIEDDWVTVGVLVNKSAPKTSKNGKAVFYLETDGSAGLREPREHLPFRRGPRETLEDISLGPWFGFPQPVGLCQTGTAMCVRHCCKATFCLLLKY
uniref:MCM10 OB-fold domain-containing protein n=1 Tax=Ixodes ricinus TaxID=34613 RepID=A0A0K8RDH5_IXORI